MSGGYFDYVQNSIEVAARKIEKLIASNNDESLTQWGDPVGQFYDPETIERFKQAAEAAHKAAAMIQRVDWLLSGDDGEESFHKRWDEEGL